MRPARRRYDYFKQLLLRTKLVSEGLLLHARVRHWLRRRFGPAAAGVSIVSLPPSGPCVGQRLPAEPKALDFHKLTCPKEVYELILKQTLRQAKARGYDWKESDKEGKAGPDGAPTLRSLLLRSADAVT